MHIFIMIKNWSWCFWNLIKNQEFPSLHHLYFTYLNCWTTFWQRCKKWSLCFRLLWSHSLETWFGNSFIISEKSIIPISGQKRDLFWYCIQVVFRRHLFLDSKKAFRGKKRPAEGAFLAWPLTLRKAKKKILFNIVKIDQGQREERDSKFCKLCTYLLRRLSDKRHSEP